MIDKHFQTTTTTTKKGRKMTKQIYISKKESANSNRIVEELNASVATCTFPNTDGVQKADLYFSKNESNVLVCSKTCAPVNDVFVKTVEIIFA